MANKKDSVKTKSEDTRSRSKKDQNEDTVKPLIKDETRYGIYGLVSLVLSFFLILSAIHKAGSAGIFIYKSFSFLFGFGYFLLPIIGIILGISLFRSQRPQVAMWHTISGTALFLSSLGLLHIASENKAGGVFGQMIAWPFIKLFDVYVTVMFLVSIILIALFVLFDRQPNWNVWWNTFLNLFRKKQELEEDTFDPEKEPEIIGHKEIEEEEQKDEPKKEVTIKNGSDDKELEIPIPKVPYGEGMAYVPPPIALLEKDRGKANVGDIKSNANIIKRTLLNFAIEVEMDEITIGPTFTRYAMKPAQGVKVARIVGLQNDLALALAAHPIRVEAPIPGKSLVGIEIPNKAKATVGLGALLGDERFKNNPKPLTVALGRDVSGKPRYVNIAKTPHALIAGTTGSGKSVTIHAIVASLLYRNGPDELKFIMVDPKRVELTLYNKIPHLLTPVITDAKKAILALKWAAKEMERRYDILQGEAVRDIESYHQNVYHKRKDKEEGLDPMPYIVIIIDELADIMQAFPRELEAAIVRLAQMSRAVGIHLILSTQRPEVNVITGLIKANVPTRIALRVPTGIDSRTILDTVGAEKLLGQGDMLYSGGEGQPERLQSAFISEDEVKKVVEYLHKMYQDEIREEIELSGTASTERGIFESSLEGGEGGDDLYEEAKRTVIESGKASTSFLQRKLGIGYARAARLIDILEEKGIVGPGNGAKPREILVKGEGNAIPEEVI